MATGGRLGAAVVSVAPGAVALAGIETVYLNGRFVNPDEARVSVFDRGFLFGDGIYEVVPVYAGRPLRWPQHIARLQRNLEILEIPNPWSVEDFDTLAAGLIGGRQDDLYLYIQVTRGVAPRDHVFPEPATPTLFAYAQVLAPAPAEFHTEGVAAITLSDIRWQRCDLKTISLVGNVWLRQKAKQNDALEALLVRDGYVTEGSASNVFAVIGGVVLTPPTGPNLLPGITRDLVIELMDRDRVEHAERIFTEAEMLDADEVWITSSTKEILPVTRINGVAVGAGRPGPVYARVRGVYQQYKAEHA